MLRRDEEQARARLIRYDADLSAVAAARRDPRRFEALYRKYVAQVYSFALYELRDPHAAEDVTARVFMNALAGLPRFRERDEAAGSSFKSWLFQIARNAIANERRRARRHPQAPIDDALALPTLDTATDPAATAIRRDELARAWRALEALPDDRRRALVLRFVLELSPREIGQLMGRTEGAVRVLLHRALRSVARSLPERG